ncbi:hypothetical protein JCM16163A_41130 [Paenibacillus sp. YK5]
MLTVEYYQKRIKKAEADLKTLETVELNYKFILIESLKNKLQEWHQAIEDLQDESAR